MTALAGLLHWRAGDEPEGMIRRMLAAQRPIASHGDSVLLQGSAALGRGLYRLVPEDAHDAGIWSASDPVAMLAADVRLDNRDDLLGAIGCPRDLPISDSELLFRCYRRWGEGLLDRIIGDYAFAHWDASGEVLTLARDPAGQCPLHYKVEDGRVLIASTPAGIHAAGVVKQPNRSMLAEFVADIPRQGSDSYYAGVDRVEPGQVVRISRQGVQKRGFWRLPERRARYTKDGDYIEAYREELDRATRARLRGAGDVVGAQLSAGLDSGAVASTAARLLAPSAGRVVAFTSAPRIGFNGPLPRGRIADESALASEVAALHHNMEHVVIRPGRMTPLELIARDGEHHQEPLGLPCNQVWLSAVSDEAQSRGLKVLLVGNSGNHTISAGGITVLSDLVMEGSWKHWWREARAARRRGLRHRGIAAASFAPWVPQPLWSLVTRLARGPSVAGEGLLMLAPELRPHFAAAAKAAHRNVRPPKDERRLRWRLLQDYDPGSFRKGVLAKWGIDERDPTSDRRLAEFCLSLPVDQLLRDGVTRRLARVALADRLPASVLHGPRGYQFADWYEWLDPASVRAFADALESSPAATSLVDLDRIRLLADTWPDEGWATGRVMSTYRLALLRALAAAKFAEQASTPRSAAMQLAR